MSSRPLRQTEYQHLTSRQAVVLHAVVEDRVQRGIVLGTLEPHLLDNQDVIWTLRALVVKRLVQLQPIGGPRLTERGRLYLRTGATNQPRDRLDREGVARVARCAATVGAHR